MANSPQARSTDTASRSPSILVQTQAGHALLDPYTTLLGPGIPIPWMIRCTKRPLTVPYDGLPSASTSSEPPAKKKRRKTGSNREITKNEQANIDLHNELRSWLPDAVEQVRNAYRCAGGERRWHSDNRLCLLDTVNAEDAPSPLDLVAWGAEIAEINALDEGRTSSDGCCSSTTMIELSNETSEEPMMQLFERIHMNDQGAAHILKTPATSFMIPPRSGFLIADMTKWHSLLADFMSKQCFNVVLLDPPWRSKSVRRSATYSEMDMYDLYKIRLDDLLAASALRHPVLVGSWVTNHAKCRRFVREKLLPRWGVTGIVDWYWVKITAGTEGKEIEEGGLPVWSYDGPSPRRCYEGLILGYFDPNNLLDQQDGPSRPVLPDKRAFMSVPLEHSRKPLVTDLLRPYLPQEQGTRVLEMFARYTPSGAGRTYDGVERSRDEETSRDLWFSVGNEALKYNEIGVQLVKSELVA